MRRARPSGGSAQIAKRPGILTVTSPLMFLTAVGTIAFWAFFFADLEAQRTSELAARSDAWYAWEMSFPLADAWMALTAMLSAVGIWRLRSHGLLFGLVSGGAMVFLGLMDALFFLRNGLYTPLTGEIGLELAIHVWAIAFGLAAIGLLWRHRRMLDGC